MSCQGYFILNGLKQKSLLSDHNGKGQLRMRRTVFLQCHYTALYYKCLLCGFKKLSSNVLTHGASARLHKTPHEKEMSSSTERVKQNFSCIPVSCLHCGVAVTLTPPLAPLLPIRALLSIQPLKPVCLIGQGRWWWGSSQPFSLPLFLNVSHWQYVTVARATAVTPFLPQR